MSVFRTGVDKQRVMEDGDTLFGKFVFVKKKKKTFVNIDCKIVLNEL